jgi:hypothetical protein
MSGYDWSAEVGNALLEAADQKIEELQAEIERLHGPRLAPEHVAALQTLREECVRCGVYYRALTAVLEADHDDRRTAYAERTGQARFSRAGKETMKSKTTPIGAGESSPAPDGSVFRDLALKVSNDISEAVDGGESREELREVVRWWADKACDEAQRRAAAEQTVKRFTLAKQLMDVAIPPNDKVSGGTPSAEVRGCQNNGG